MAEKQKRGRNYIHFVDFSLKLYENKMTTIYCHFLTLSMHKRLQEIAEDIGLNRREARVYLALLSHPESSLAEVARITLIPRMSCYVILRNLFQKGFVDVLVKKRRRYFVAVHPQKILERLERRAGEWKGALPRFERHMHMGPATPRVRFFEGREGIRAVFRRILDEKRPFAAITSIDDMERINRTYFEDFIGKRIQQRLRVRLLTNRTPSALRLKQTDFRDLRETRFLPSSCRFHTAEYIFGDAVALVSFQQAHPVALIIEDSEIAKTHMMYILSCFGLWQVFAKRIQLFLFGFRAKSCSSLWFLENVAKYTGNMFWTGIGDKARNNTKKEKPKEPRSTRLF